MEAWLQTITAAAPHAPVIVVATHCAGSTPGLAAADLRTRYPQVQHLSEVDCAAGSGIDDLRDLIAHQAARLPLVGQRWAPPWAAAAPPARREQETRRGSSAG
ncbi:hypothetical protein ABZ907_46145, partial [Nonomuraea wenchangensis]